MRLNHSQRFVLLNALFFAIYAGFGDTFVVPFALALGASNTYIGILSAIPWLAMILSQYPGQSLTSYLGRKTIYTVFTIPDRLGVPIIASLPFLLGPLALPYILVVVFLAKICANLTEPAWLSVLSDSVDKSKRGVFFGLRYLMLNIGLTGSMVLAGVFLDLFKPGDLRGFAVIFVISSCFGLLSTFAFSKVKASNKRIVTKYSLKQFLHVDGQFRTFLIFTFCFGFGHMLAAPFFKVYILENLAMSYTFYVLAMTMSTIGRLISMVHVGRVADLVGDKKILVLATIATASVPFFYLFVHLPTVWLIFPIQLIAGMAWAGMEVGTLNMLLDLSDGDQKELRAGQYFTVSAVAMMIAPVLGGLLADDVSLWMLGGIPLVFAIATVLRVAAATLLSPLQDIRAKRQVGYWGVLKRYLRLHPITEAKTSIRQVSDIFLRHHRQMRKAREH